MDASDALKMFERAKTYWYDNYDAAEEDLRFSVGLDHWDAKDITVRKDRPCLVINELPQFIHQVANDIRQNTPSINVIPIGSESSIETAKVYKGLVRNIEYRSAADEVYDTAGEYAVRCGHGFILVDHDYENDQSLFQELLIKKVANPLSWWIDPSSIESDGSDANWAVGLEQIAKEEFEQKYPGKKFISFDITPGNTKQETDVISLGQVFKKEYKDVIINASGEEVEEEIEGSTRKLKKVIIRRYKFSGDGDALEETTFPGKYIPVVPVYGEEVWINGKRFVLSLIRQSKDAQRRLNHWASKESEILAMAPIAPIMAPFGQTEDFNEWNSPNDATVLRYKTVDAGGNPLPPPQRLAPPPVPTGIVNAMQGAKENIKETMGLYNASIGSKSNEVSGVAINARKVEGDTATLHFGDNLARSIQHVGRIIVAAAPEIYDTARIVRIISDEEEPSMVGINGHPPLEGQEAEHDLRKGQYDVRVITGSSYTTKRQESAALLSDLIKANPELMGVVGDLLFKNMDVAGADAIAARIKKTIPPALLADEDAKNGEQPQADPQKEQMGQMIAQLQEQVQQLGSELQNKQADTQIKQGELGIKQQELQLKSEELKLKAVEFQKEQTPVANVQEASIKEREMALKEAEFQLKVLQAMGENPAEASQGEDMGSANDSVGMLQQRIQQKISEQELQGQREQQEQMEAQAKLEQTQAIIQALQNISAQVGDLTQAQAQTAMNTAQLTQAVSQPIQVVRDESGAIVGAQ